MMTLEQYLEKDKEQLILQLKNAQDPLLCQQIVERQIDRLLYVYNEETQDAQRRAHAAAILQTIRMSAPLLDCQEEMRTTSGEPSDKRAAKLWFALAFVLTFAGALCSALGILLPFLSSVQDEQRIAMLLLCAVGLGCLYLGGYLRGILSADKKAKPLAVHRSVPADPYRIYRTLHAMMITADEQLEHMAAHSTQQASSGYLSAAPADQQMGIYADLLEALYSQDGQFALDRIAALQYYLHTQGIEAEDYTDEHADWFDRIPAKTACTIRPALIRDTEVLVRGLAGGD